MKILGREAYARRQGVLRKVMHGQCRRCRTHIGQQFQRNGHYRRQLVTRLGQVAFRMPQLVCECGGGVRVAFGTVRRRLGEAA